MEELFRRIESFILEKMSEYKMPSVSIAIVEDGKAIYKRGFGFRDISNALPADENTLYGVGSITKSFTALSIMQLVEKGLVSLDDNIEKYLKVVPRAFRDVTIHHLLTHSSGIPALAYAEAYIRGLTGVDGSWLPINKPEDIAIFMDRAHKWRESKPGERFFYLNEGYATLGKIIEKVSGLRYTEYVHKNILKPLKMKNSFFNHEHESIEENWAKPYIIDERGEIKESRFPFGIESDGGLISNVMDLTRYINMYINNGRYDGEAIIDRASIEMMEKLYIRLPYQEFGGEGYGYGLIITPNFYGYKLIGHSGSLLVHTGYMGYIRDKGIGVAVLSNASGYRLSFIGKFVLASLLNKKPGEMYFVMNEIILKKLEGDYQTYKNTTKAKVLKEDSVLYLIIREGGRERRIPLIPKVIEEDYVSLETYVSWRRYNVEFYIKDNKIDLIYERYKFRKVI
jgi:CubicO group peptidase (beta-lactamase class C family)